MCYTNYMKHYRTYTVQEKVTIYTYYQEHGWKDTAKKHKVPLSTFVAWQRKVNKGGAPLATLLQRKPKRHTVCEKVVAAVKKLHAQHPEFSLETLRKRVSHIQPISRTTVWKVVSGKQ